MWQNTSRRVERGRKSGRGNEKRNDALSVKLAVFASKRNDDSRNSRSSLRHGEWLARCEVSSRQFGRKQLADQKQSNLEAHSINGFIGPSDMPLRLILSVPYWREPVVREKRGRMPQ